MASDQSYFNQPFVWGTNALGIFYERSFVQLYNCFHKWFSDDKDEYKDVFQNAMLKLTLKIEKAEKIFSRNIDAFRFLKKIFYHTMIDDFRRHKKLDAIVKEMTYTSRETYPEFAYSLEADRENDLRSLLMAAEKLMQSGIKLFNKSELEFFYYFMAAVMHFFSDRDIKLAVVTQLEMSDSKYYNLKSRVIAILRKALN